MWEKAIKKQSLYIPIDVHWSQVPGRDEKWKQETISNTSEQQFRQEFGCITGDTLIEIEDMETGEIKKLPIEELFNLCQNS